MPRSLNLIPISLTRFQSCSITSVQQLESVEKYTITRPSAPAHTSHVCPASETPMHFALRAIFSPISLSIGGHHTYYTPPQATSHSPPTSRMYSTVIVILYRLGIRLLKIQLKAQRGLTSTSVPPGITNYPPVRPIEKSLCPHKTRKVSQITHQSPLQARQFGNEAH